MRTRIQILISRAYGDDESDVLIAAYGAEDNTDLAKEVEAEYRKQIGLGPDDPLVESDGHDLYINNDITIEDGGVLEYRGKRFRVRIEEIHKSEVENGHNS